MKTFKVFSLIFFAMSIEASVLTTAKSSHNMKPECTNANFWCENILTAKNCNAVDYCIKAVWETHVHTPLLKSNIVCDECKNWVAKARSYVENSDVEIIRNLEMICHNIPFKSLEKTCLKITDEDAQSVLKMIESQMDPDVVCSNLFLCGNQLLDQSNFAAKKSPLQCGQCQAVGKMIESTLMSSNQDLVLEKLLGVCGEMSSYSDSCTSIVLTYFDDILKFMKVNIKSKAICETSCKKEKKVGIYDIEPALDDSNIGCQLCQQLFVHLSEVFVINTSEVEFKNVLLGFCEQMGSFNKECTIIVDQYHETIYNFLKDNLNANKTCVAVGVCKAEKNEFLMPHQPLILSELFALPKTVVEMKVHNSLTLEKNGHFCATCQSFIHLLHEALEKQTVDDILINQTKRVCSLLPSKIQPECLSMVELYGDAIMSLWAQNMNPNVICPEIKLCPPVLTIDYLEQTAVSDKPTCPFCLMALQDVKDYIASNRTKSNIENALSRLCSHLSTKLLSQCTEFVKTYSSEVVDMMLADFTPQDACTFINLCSNDQAQADVVKIADVSYKIHHEVADSNDGLIVSNPQCELCKEVIKIVEQRVINKKSKDEIRRELEHSCDRLKKFHSKCKKFVDKYSDKIVDLIEAELEPAEVCHQIQFCVTADRIEYQDYDSGLEVFLMSEKEPTEEISEMPQCVLCEFIIAKIDDELSDKNVTEHLKQVIKNICSKMPSTISKECNQFIDYYYNMIIVLIEITKPNQMCAEMRLCPEPKDQDTQLYGMIQNDIYKCAMCKGVLETFDTIIEDPYTDANLENLEEKLCEKFAGKYKEKCHDFAKNYGLIIINLMKTVTNSDEICYKMNFCDMSSSQGTLQITDY